MAVVKPRSEHPNAGCFGEFATVRLAIGTAPAVGLPVFEAAPCEASSPDVGWRRGQAAESFAGKALAGTSGVARGLLR
jgi:hypothetical protein